MIFTFKFTSFIAVNFRKSVKIPKAPTLTSLSFYEGIALKYKVGIDFLYTFQELCEGFTFSWSQFYYHDLYNILK
jgi:hypothetical protein